MKSKNVQKTKDEFDASLKKLFLKKLTEQATIDYFNMVKEYAHERWTNFVVAK